MLTEHHYNHSAHQERHSVQKADRGYLVSVFSPWKLRALCGKRKSEKLHPI